MTPKLIAWGQYVLPSAQFQPPGNSLRLIDAAYGYGYDGVELDFQLTKDRQLVLMHDHTLDRTTHGSGRVVDFTAEELSRVLLKDPFNGVPAYVDTLEAALRRNGDRGYVMVDMHHVVPVTVEAVKIAVVASGFDPKNLLLLSYKREGGLLYKQVFPDATVLLKAPHDFLPPELDISFVGQAEGLDGVLVPIAMHEEAITSFREATSARSMKLAVFMHTGDWSELQRISEGGPDFITSYSPREFGRLKRALLSSSH